MHTRDDARSPEPNVSFTREEADRKMSLTPSSSPGRATWGGAGANAGTVSLHLHN